MFIVGVVLIVLSVLFVVVFGVLIVLVCTGKLGNSSAPSHRTQQVTLYKIIIVCVV